MPLKDKLRPAANVVKSPAKAPPLWRGPEVDGITQSLLSRFLVDRERFRVYAVEGLRPADHWNHRSGYGDMWHVCEEQWATGQGGSCWYGPLTDYCRSLLKRYPLQQEEIAKWYEVCQAQFPLCVDFWKRHPDVVAREPLLAEQVFDVPYRLPSGRTVRLRGKWDSVDLVSEKCSMCGGIGGRANVHTGRYHPCAACEGAKVRRGIWLQENKTKGDVDPQQLVRQLNFDLQTMLYLVALEQYRLGNFGTPHMGLPTKGVRYNVVRRPLSGGKGTIVQGKGTKGSKCSRCRGGGKVYSKLKQPVPCPKCGGAGRSGGKPAETKEDYYARLAQYIRDEPETYFFRWNVLVTADDLARFRRQFLDPVLEQLCDWWDYISMCSEYKADPFNPTSVPNADFVNNGVHYRMPYGVYNPLLEGVVGDLDNYLDTGDQTGLQRVGDLFPELRG